MTTWDVGIIGSGPASLAAAVACAEASLRVLVLAGPDVGWSANYGVWAHEFEALGLGRFLGPVWSDALMVYGDDHTQATGRRYGRVAKVRLRSHLLGELERLGVDLRWVRAVSLDHDPIATRVGLEDGTTVRVRMVVDASGHKPAFVRREGGPTTFQAAVGFLGAPSSHPWDPDRMTFMDLRMDHVDDALGQAVPTFLYTMPISAQRVFVEETSLVRGPAVPFPILLQRLRRRLDRLGVRMEETEATEMCLIPMNTPMPDLDQRVVGFGGAASMVHPATGYLLSRAFHTAPDLAAVLADGLDAGVAPAALARDAWRTIWTDDDRLRRDLHLFGSEILATLDADEQRRFFEAFFAMPTEVWSDYLAGRGEVGGVVRAMASMLYHSGFRIRWKLLRSGTRLPGVLMRAAG